ncbi:MAG: hypothetical protein IJY92_00050 [Alphaproteobacteria bacterium]|nr:hypothetical protein [Alphaproteobacteria bacterium]
MTDKINIAFSFDKNYYKPALVAISSLLDAGNRDGCQYNLYLLVKDDITQDIRSEIVRFISKKSQKSSVIFVDMKNYFDDGYETRGISKTAYSRLLLPQLVNVDKIIYSDVDVLFLDSLKSVWNLDLSNYYYAGIKDISVNTEKIWQSLIERFPYWKKEMSQVKGNYHQSGFLILNQSKWEKEHLESKIKELSKQHFNYQDQDILNVLFKDKQDQILTLSCKYCYMPKHDYETAVKENVISEEDYVQTKNNPAIIHYPGEKPWKNPNVIASDLWWNYVKKNTQYYKYFKSELKKTMSDKKEYKIRIHVLGFDIFSKRKKENKRIYKILGLKFTVKKKVKSPFLNTYPIKNIGKNNQIYLLKTNGEKEQLLSKAPIPIEIIGNDNLCIIPETTRWLNTKIVIYSNHSSFTMGIPANEGVVSFEANIKHGDYQKITIGKGFSMGSGLIMANEENSTISIGDNCMFSADLHILSSDGHTIKDFKTHKVINYSNNIKIGHHVWVGRNVQIIKNTDIPDNCIVGIGSVVNKKFTQKNAVIAGVPAHVVKTNIEWERTSPTKYKIQSNNQ